jgi:ribonuclease HII
MLSGHYTEEAIEAGCDEAGRGCLAGPVFAAAVILPREFRNKILDDSKKLSRLQRLEMRTIIEKEAISWAVSSVVPSVIDEINILNASFLAMHQAINDLSIHPQLLLIDGNRFTPYKKIPHLCIIKGDGKFLSIAAASVLAKTYRDEYMEKLHQQFPVYDWKNNKGYPCKKHREGIARFGISPYHRITFRLNEQLKLDLK